jgi:hypothetical protein
VHVVTRAGLTGVNTLRQPNGTVTRNFVHQYLVPADCVAFTDQQIGL